MIKFIEMCHLNSLKKRRIFLLILLMIGLLMILARPDGSSHEIKLYQSDYYNYHMPLLKMALLILTATLITLFIYDHEPPYFIYFHVENFKSKLAISKLLYSIIYGLLICLPLYLVFLLVPIYFTYQTDHFCIEFIFIIDIMIDHIIITVLILTFINYKNELIAFIILIVRLILFFVQEDIASLWFYILPLTHTKMILQNYYFHYKILYLCLVILIYFFKMDTSDV
jgi:hypothetical protein